MSIGLIVFLIEGSSLFGYPLSLLFPHFLNSCKLLYPFLRNDFLDYHSVGSSHRTMITDIWLLLEPAIPQAFDSFCILGPVQDTIAPSGYPLLFRGVIDVGVSVILVRGGEFDRWLDEGMQAEGRVGGHFVEQLVVL